MKQAIKRSSRKMYRWLRHPRHRKRSKFRNWLAEKVFDRRMWTHPTAHTFAGGLAAGLAVGMVIVPFQMVIVAVICCFLRFHIPVAAAAVWISNPVTWLPCLVFEYNVGKWLYRITGKEVPEIGELNEFSVWDLDLKTAMVIYSGAAFCALAAAAISYPIGLWIGQRMAIKRESRRNRQLEMARQRALLKAETEGVTESGK